MTSMPAPEPVDETPTPSKTRTPIDPTWPSLLIEIHGQVELMDRLRADADRAAAKVDALVHEAVDEGERYRDIAAAAGRSVPWVQTVLRRLNVEGPRVRIITTRAAKAKRLDEEEAAERKAKRLDNLKAAAEAAVADEAPAPKPARKRKSTNSLDDLLP